MNITFDEAVRATAADDEQSGVHALVPEFSAMDLDDEADDLEDEKDEEEE